MHHFLHHKCHHSVDGVFAQQLNTFVKLLAERLGERFGVEYGKMANYTKNRIHMSILRVAILCIRGTR